MKSTKRKVITALLVMLALAAGYKFLFPALYRTYSKDEVTELPVEPLLGVYNRLDSLSGKALLPLQHIMIRWNKATATEGYKDKLKPMLAAGKPVLLTLETWPVPGNKLGNENILSDLAKGEYDEKIKDLGVFLSTYHQPILLRLNPEMEVYVTRYPWQMQSSELYKQSFNHFAELCKSAAPAVKIVWAPAGYPGADEYWPGARWVDFISATLKSKSESMTKDYPEEASMAQLIKRKIFRLRFFDRPVLLLGSENVKKENFQQQWLDSAAAGLRQNGELVYMDVNAAEKLDSVKREQGSRVITGVYDPTVKLASNSSIAVEHLFVNIGGLQDGSFKREFDSAKWRNHDVIVTMEPWKNKQKKQAKDPDLLVNILNGKYDQEISELYGILATTNHTVYLRWLHEMEIPITRYPWQSQNPVMYIKAFRYFVQFPKVRPANIRYVWGPAGDRGSMEFWPGSDVVDFISIAIYGLPDKNITDHNKQENFNTIFKRKYNRLRFAHKPLFITEFGVKGPEEYKKKWMADAAGTIIANRVIFGVSYFNFADSPKAWGNIEAPDWSITPATFADFLQQLNTGLKQ